MSDTSKVLILCPGEDRQRLSALLAGQGYQVHAPGDLRAAVDHGKSWDIDVAMLHAGSKEIDPLEILQELLRRIPDIRVIMVAEYSSVDLAVKALRHGAHGYILKPLARDALLKSVETAVAQKQLIVSERRRAEAELMAFKKELDFLVKEETRSLFDVNARLQQDLESLKRDEAQYRSLFRTAKDAIFLKDKDLKYTAVNPAMERLFGLPASQWIGKTDEEIFGEQRGRSGHEIDARVLGGEVVEDEEMLEVKGVNRALHVIRHPLRNGSGEVSGLWGLARDMSETKRLERQVQAAQRIEALGTLAGGIAHNFNNLLTGILGTVSLLLVDIDPSDPKHRKLKRMEEYVRKGVTLTRQLVGFARGGKYEIKLLNLNEVIEKTAGFLPETGNGLNIHREEEPALWLVKGDEGQMEQVLLNLFVNAWQAMPGGGQLHIKTQNKVLDETHVRPYEVKAGRYVQVTVMDTGIGMDQETQRHIFEPFFTTKEAGAATGLGLAAVYGIVKNHGGFIDVFSEVGRGTKFEILLPAVKEEELERTGKGMKREAT